MAGIGNSIGDVCTVLGDIGTQLRNLEKGKFLSSLKMEVEAISTNLKFILEEIENKQSGDNSSDDEREREK